MSPSRARSDTRRHNWPPPPAKARTPNAWSPGFNRFGRAIIYDAAYSRRRSASNPRRGRLLRALVHPSPDHSDLLRRQRLRRRSHGPFGGRLVGAGGERSRTLRPLLAAARPTALRLRRHRALLIQPGYGDDQLALGALPGHDDLAIFAAFEHPFQAVEVQTRLGPIRAVAAETGGLEDGPDVL